MTAATLAGQTPCISGIAVINTEEQKQSKTITSSEIVENYNDYYNLTG